MNRFRPNIVVTGIEEHDEDYFTHARCGEVALRFVNPCFRCSLTSIDQQSATPGLDVLPVLSTYRYDEAAKGVKFGAYARLVRASALVCMSIPISTWIGASNAVIGGLKRRRMALFPFYSTFFEGCPSEPRTARGRLQQRPLRCLKCMRGQDQLDPTSFENWMC